MIDLEYYESLRRIQQLADFFEDEKRENQRLIIRQHIRVAGQAISDLFDQNELLRKQIGELTKEQK